MLRFAALTLVLLPSVAGGREERAPDFTLLLEARRLISADDLPSAEAAAEKLSARHPRSGAAALGWLLVARSWREEGRNARASDALVRHLRGKENPRPDEWAIAARWLREAGEAGKGRDLLLETTLKDAKSRNRFLVLLARISHSKESLRELLGLVRFDEEAFEELSRCFLAVGQGEPDLLRAINLVRLALRAGRDRYSHAWWRRNLLLCETYCEFGERFSNRSALRNVVKLVDDWETIGVLEGCGCAKEFRALRDRAR